MALIRGVLGRDQRHGNGTYADGRRSTDPDTHEKHQVLERVESTERRLANYQRVRLPR